MTPAEARELAQQAEKLAANAEGGPWFTGVNGGPPTEVCDESSSVIAECYDVPDANFIADARTRVPALCAALRELADENERLWNWLAHHPDSAEVPDA